MIDVDLLDRRSKLNWIPPWWWRTPEEQLQRARGLWPDIWLPAPPIGFTPQSRTGVLLLHVPRLFDELWSSIVLSGGYKTTRWTYFKSDKEHLHLSPWAVAYAGPAWIELDPEYGRGLDSDEQLWEGASVSPAALEVVSGLIQFSDWPLAWLRGASAPNLSGFRSIHKGSSLVPFLNRWQAIRQLKLQVLRAGIPYNNWAWPSVRGIS